MTHAFCCGMPALNCFCAAAVLNYAVMVYTSGAKESATEANVEILLKGEMGDSGWHPLSSSKVHNVKWLSGQMDLFTLEAVHLGRLSSLMLQHDGQTEGEFSAENV